MKDLTARQREVFDLLVAFQKTHGYPPSQKEVADLMGAASPNAATELLRSLVAGDLHAREEAIAFLEMRGVSV